LREKTERQGKEVESEGLISEKHQRNNFRATRQFPKGEGREGGGNGGMNVIKKRRRKSEERIMEIGDTSRARRNKGEKRRKTNLKLE